MESSLKKNGDFVSTVCIKTVCFEFSWDKHQLCYITMFLLVIFMDGMNESIQNPGLE